MPEANNLIHLLRSVLSDSKTGVLSVRATLDTEMDGNRTGEQAQSFSFLFRRGCLVSARFGTIQDHKVMALVGRFGQVTKLKWTPMNTDAITGTDDNLSLERLIDTLLRTDQKKSNLQRLDSPTPASPLRESARVQRRVKRVFHEVFGDSSSAMLAFIVRETDPDQTPIGFLQKCIEHLAPYIGHEEATNLLMPRRDN